MLKKLFGQTVTAPVDEKPRIERLESKLRELQESMQELARDSKSIRLEWEEAYDKLQHLMARITKRQKMAEKDEKDSPPELREAGDLEQPPAAPISGYRPGSHAVLQAMRAKHGLLPR